MVRHLGGLSFIRRITGLGAAIWLFGLSSLALACSTVALGRDADLRIVYSYDQSESGAGILLLNPAGAERRSIMGAAGHVWTARFGSVTFNQFGPGMPTAGQNTEGLVVTLMWNNAVVYGGPPTRPIVNELELIQLLLDSAATVEEALTLLDQIAIVGMVPIHFFMADARGDMAILTPRDSGIDIHRGREMPIPALTNTSYNDLLDEITVLDGFGGDRPIPRRSHSAAPSSLERFAIGAIAARAQSGPVDDTTAIRLLQDLANPVTQWQIVFSPRAGEIHYRLIGETRLNLVDVSEADLTCYDTPMHLHLAAPVAPAPLSHELLTSQLQEVLTFFPEASGISPEVAPEMANAQLAAVMCPE